MFQSNVNIMTVKMITNTIIMIMITSINSKENKYKIDS